ncbi:diaminopimelate decarboxylase [Emticicia sp. W12TSBA100-4]|uniref:diaminopimelate decarboxylase n=1 Tax=Emticicia sp. W12TSBA100-4 TaxID=3160965 RepID=UPI0033062635
MFSIQNIGVEALAEQFGTPVYVYDGHKIEEQIAKMRTAFAGTNLKIKYACKALTNVSIMKLMRKNGVDIDVVSMQEAHLAILAGYAPNQIQYTPSGVAFSEVQEAVEMGLRMNLDSLPLLEKFGQTYGNLFPICLRINPHIMAGGTLKISTGHKDSKFGISIEQAEEINAIVQKYDLNVVGLHQHTGSDFKNANVIIEAAEKLFDLTFKYFPNIQFIDLGSGFKVAYKEDDHVTDMEKLGEGVVKVFNDFCEKFGRDVELWFEPGKFLVSESGYLLARANVVKYSPERNFIGVDSGLNHLIRPMMYDAYHEIINGSNLDGEEKEMYDIVGYICETDTFGKDRKLPKTKEGDIIVIKNAGAYGFSMASNYNSRFRPAEVLIYNGQTHLIRQRETMEDILKNQVMIDL